MKKIFKRKTIGLILIIFSILMITGGMQTTAIGGDEPLKLEMKGHLVVFYNDDTGKEIAKLMPLPEIVEKGDIIQYDILGKNVSAKALNNINAGGKIPESTLYIQKSARCDVENTVSFSADNGKKFAAPPVKEIVKNKDGKRKEVVVSSERYTDIRFTIKKLEPGKEFTASYGVTVK